MRAEQIIKKLEALESAGKMETVLLLIPKDIGTYEAVDQYHKGKVYTDEQMHKHNGPVIIWDV